MNNDNNEKIKEGFSVDAIDSKFTESYADDESGFILQKDIDLGPEMSGPPITDIIDNVPGLSPIMQNEKVEEEKEEVKKEEVQKEIKPTNEEIDEKRRQRREMIRKREEKKKRMILFAIMGGIILFTIIAVLLMRL